MALEYKGKTEQQWLDLINSYTVNMVIEKLFQLLFPGASHKYDGKESYKNLIMQNKPPIRVFQDELDLLKIEKLAEIDVIFRDLEIRFDIITRLKALKHPDAALSAVSGEPNADLVAKKIIKEKDIAMLILVEAKDAELEALSVIRDDESQTRDVSKKALGAHLDTLISDPTAANAIKALKDILIYLKD